MNLDDFNDDELRRFGRNRSALDLRAIRLRLFLLMAALVLVLIAMKEVQRPERWKWMGFKEEQQQPVDVDAGAGQGGDDRAADSDADRNRFADQRVDSVAGPEESELSNANRPGALAGQSPTGENEQGAQGDANGAVVEWRPDRLWQKVWPRLERPARRQLVRVIRRGLFASDQLAISDDGFQSLLKQWARECERLERDLLERITLATPGSAARQSLNQTLLDVRHQCARQTTALRRAATERSLEAADASELRQILGAVESIVWADVVDHTPVRRAADGLAWILAWQKVLNQIDDCPTVSMDQPADDRPVSVLQLMNQPRSYRGRQVRVEGWIRGVQVVQGKPNELGMDTYYVAWLQNSGTETTPICLYVAQWPEEIPVDPSRFTKLNVKASAMGVFFKIRTYQAADGEWASCPLVLARSVEILPEPKVASAREQVCMPLWGWGLFLATMPFVAGLVAWVVYRWTQSTTPLGGKQVVESLAELEKDASIMSPRDQVGQLERDPRLGPSE